MQRIIFWMSYGRCWSSTCHVNKYNVQRAVSLGSILDVAENWRKRIMLKASTATMRRANRVEIFYEMSAKNMLKVWKQSWRLRQEAANSGGESIESYCTGKQISILYLHCDKMVHGLWMQNKRQMHLLRHFTRRASCSRKSWTHLFSQVLNSRWMTSSRCAHALQQSCWSHWMLARQQPKIKSRQQFWRPWVIV